jgi:putative SOS response-associated peptidase YedK
MCGRFTLTRSAAEVAAHFELAEPAELAPRWNVAPGQAVAAVRARAPGGGARVLEHRPWGLRVDRAPSGTQAPGPLVVNARAETAASRPAFRSAWRRRRCLVPADGFYEWRRGRPRAPYHVARSDGGLLALAALYDEDREGAPRGPLVVLTAEARGPVRRLHDRMPVLVAPAGYAAWLDPRADDPSAALRVAQAQDLAAGLALRPVSRHVNDVAHDDPGCLAPPEEPELPLG